MLDVLFNLCSNHKQSVTNQLVFLAGLRKTQRAFRGSAIHRNHRVYWFNMSRSPPQFGTRICLYLPQRCNDCVTVLLPMGSHTYVPQTWWRLGDAACGYWYCRSPTSDSTERCCYVEHPATHDVTIAYYIHNSNVTTVLNALPWTGLEWWTIMAYSFLMRISGLGPRSLKTNTTCS